MVQFPYRSISNRYPIQFLLLRQILNIHPFAHSLRLLVHWYPFAPLGIAWVFHFTQLLNRRIPHRRIQPRHHSRQTEPNLPRPNTQLEAIWIS